MSVELLEFDLGFEAVLGFHDYVYQFVVVIAGSIAINPARRKDL